MNQITINIDDLIEELQELYNNSLVPFSVSNKEDEINQKGESLAYLDVLNLFKERFPKLLTINLELVKNAINEVHAKYNQTLISQPNESKEDIALREGKHFGYYYALNTIELYLIVFRYPRRLFDVIAPDLNNIDKKIDNIIIKPLPSRSEIKEKLLLLLETNITKKDKEAIDAWARDWIIANPEAGKIENRIVWEILHNLQFISYASDDSDLKDDIKEWLAELEKIEPSIKKDRSFG